MVKYCPKCGTPNDDDANFCIKCGYRFPAPSVAQAPGSSSQQTPQPSSPPQAGAPRAQEAFALLSRANEIHQQSETSDYRMPVILPFLPSILVFIGFVVFIVGMAATLGSISSGTYSGTAPFAGLLLGGIAILIVALVVYIYVIYRWVARRNSHFERSNLLLAVFADLSASLKMPNFELIRMRYDELQQVNQKRRSAGLNVLGFIIVPFYQFYVFHFLNKDFVQHSQKEGLYLQELFSSLRASDPYFARQISEFKQVNDRSTLLYVILTLFTLGLFGIYWVYTLAKDPNEHFDSHGVVEADIISSFERLSKATLSGQ